MFHNLVLNLIKIVFVYLFDCKTNNSNYAKIIKFNNFSLLLLKIHSLIVFKASKEKNKIWSSLHFFFQFYLQHIFNAKKWIRNQDRGIPVLLIHNSEHMKAFIKNKTSSKLSVWIEPLSLIHSLNWLCYLQKRQPMFSNGFIIQ
jgi:hypothetical protein